MSAQDCRRWAATLRSSRSRRCSRSLSPSSAAGRDAAGQQAGDTAAFEKFRAPQPAVLALMPAAAAPAAICSHRACDCRTRRCRGGRI
eukprot:3059994-Prymnesium_polylepis.2